MKKSYNKKFHEGKTRSGRQFRTIKGGQETISVLSSPSRPSSFITTTPTFFNPTPSSFTTTTINNNNSAQQELQAAATSANNINQAEQAVQATAQARDALLDQLNQLDSQLAQNPQNSLIKKQIKQLLPQYRQAIDQWRQANTDLGQILDDDEERRTNIALNNF